ncbi:MAG: hypothetical protein WC934_15290, partial [Acidithiobacillus sp.]|uniref:hypothetical protein n=1 Tax=Acidithiobacillus sp. TaxID=1872118 RepID=UPI00355ED395
TEGLVGVDIEKVEAYILLLTKSFNIVKVVYDQFDSTSSIQKFQKLGLNAEKTPFSVPYIMKIYKNLKKMIYENRIKLINNEYGIKELKCLQEVKRQKKQFVVVAGENSEVTTDDLADVVANAAFVALENYIKNKGSSSVTTGKNRNIDNADIKTRGEYLNKLRIHNSIDKVRAVNGIRRQTARTNHSRPSRILNRSRYR